MVIKSIIIAIIYWLAWSRIGYTFSMILRQPLTLAVPLGLLMGDVRTAIIIGASLEMIYMGIVPAGNNIPSDEGLAACIAIPIAIQMKMNPQMAVSLAVPVGMLGVLIDNVRRTVNATWVHMADKYAEEANTSKIMKCATIYPLLLQLPLRGIPVFLASLYGPTGVQAFMKVIPEWFTHGLTVAGGIMPALGFALTINVIGKRNLLPYFFVGFFLVQYSKISVIGAAIFGICAAFIHIQFQPNKGGTEA
ncbi:PTS mannose/fructose/sorbose/N-acetylgalactosamine transporter subunit IIC [Sporanaerobacter sp. PP17-6a]|jgi:D-glucosaminate-specific PTS system IIC component|uniref:PTS mannose/fructose/sorbose/N-acetylgalactosamine transporter subunit IIC n=1 Tax=Sporanaerobacter sp. PP17-6a TaxID=1891289 RepID=UPI0008A073B0|nr:PTS sugar transporter subunit IIC [Sporanaerobacter sp. PP17-6a]MBE6083459.1 PTS sugar transporter subunit IIC [Tissierellaceae bacterium]SCL90385.1 PTS system N-acetylgalactosamine-specific EIIC component 1 [Sporanaerobacter sp. PP17-6a]